MDIKTQFGQRIRELRNELGLSQEELAMKCKIHRTYMGGIERGERNPCLENIEIIAKAIGVEVKDLFM